MTDRTCVQAKTHLKSNAHIRIKEYVKLKDISSLASSFTAPSQLFPSPLILSKEYIRKVLSFTPKMITALKGKAMNNKCSSFESIVAHLWRARTKAIFTNSDKLSTVLFAVDIRSKIYPNTARWVCRECCDHSICHFKSG